MAECPSIYQDKVKPALSLSATLAKMEKNVHREIEMAVVKGLKYVHESKAY